MALEMKRDVEFLATLQLSKDVVMKTADVTGNGFIYNLKRERFFVLVNTIMVAGSNDKLLTIGLFISTVLIVPAVRFPILLYARMNNL